jgi:PKD domain/Subtilase family
MNTRHIYMNVLCVISAALAGALPHTVLATDSTHKLGTRIAVIAAAAQENRSQVLMSSALTREIFQRNSPLEARWNAAGEVQVSLHYDRSGAPPKLNSLKALGANSIVVSEPLAVVQAWVPAGALYQLAALPEVTRITIPRYAMVKRAFSGSPLPRTGSVDSQGDQILNAQLYRTLTGFTGAGVSVGVISDGDDHIASSQSTGDLPAAIWDDPSLPGSGDEGTAMMEIVHDLAPGANLGFCGPETDVDFVQCLTDFANHFGDSNLVIVDDLGFPGIAMFTDDPDFAVPIQQFQASNPDVRLVTAAGNDAENFWTGSWNPTSIDQTINGINYTEAQNFGSSTSPNTGMSFYVEPGDTVDYILEWADSWPSLSGNPPDDPNDYDVALLDSQGNILSCVQGENFGVATDPPSATSCPYTGAPASTTTPGPQPVMGFYWTNNGSSTANVSLEILYRLADGNPDQHLKVLVFTQNYQVTISPRTAAGSIYGQSALPYPAEITAGADNENSPDSIEFYSSQGPIFLSQPATGSSMRMKPDFVGVDCVSVTGAGGFPNPFCGTSAAAPHIAALVALLESGFPGDDPYDLLMAGAMPLGSGSPNGVYGYGLPNAVHSVASMYGSPTASITAPANGAILTTGQATNFSGNCSANGAPGTVGYDWNFGAASGIGDFTTANPSVTFKYAGQYMVTLTCTNQFGNTGTASINFSVQTTPSSGSGGGGWGMMTLGALLLLQLSSALLGKSGGA